MEMPDKISSLDYSTYSYDYRNGLMSNARVPILIYLNTKCLTGPWTHVVACWFCRIWPAVSRAGSGPRWVSGWWSCREPEHRASISPASVFCLCSHSRSSPEMHLEPPRLSGRLHTLAATETCTDALFCSYRWTQRAWQRFPLPFPSSASALLQLCCVSFGAVREIG